MLTRVENGVTYQQAWDAENRLTVVTNTVSGAVTTFTYDGDGARVKKVDAAGTTAYAGSVEARLRSVMSMRANHQDLKPAPGALTASRMMEVVASRFG